MKNIAIVILMILSVAAAHAQEMKEDTIPTRPMQITFVPPMGTNGLESGKYINNFSINILGGYNGGVDGVEMGNFLNMTQYYVKGFQAAGFANINAGYMQGVQMSGFANVNADSARGFQGSGFANINGGKTTGAQLAGFANINGDTSGSTALSGFMNVTVGGHNGTQVAGFANIATEDLQGVQVSGFLNYARNVKGVQLGFINIADTVEGTSIAFLNLVRHGYNTLEFNVTESAFTTAALKLGANRFYNIFTAGVQPASEFRWAVGYGIGTYIPFSERLGMNFDFIGYHINERGYWTLAINEMGRINANFNVKIADKFTLTAGPTFNVMVSEYYRSEEQVLGSNFPPYYFYDHTTDYGINIKMWAGANVGIRF